MSGRARKWMNSRRRFLSAMFGGRVDRLPVGTPTSVATIGLMEQTGAYFPQAHLNARMMADLAAAGHEILGYDNVMPVFSVVQEAAALGCEVDWGDPESMPVERTHPYADPEDIRIPSDFMERPSIKVVLQAISLLRRRYGSEVAIVGKCMGPWTLSYHLHGVQQFLLETVLDADRVRRFLDVLKEITVLFGRAQIEAGADLLCIGDHATGDLVSPACYRDFLLPVHQELAARLGCPVVLHICGNTANRLEYIVQTGFDAFHFDSKVDARQACDTVANRISLVGNVNNPQTLLLGTPQDVRREVFYAARAGVHIVGPECAVPPTTPVENLRAVAVAADEISAPEVGQAG